jgi:hypothetical protein
VQAVDSAFAGGPFAVERNFDFNVAKLSIARSGANAVVSWTTPSSGWILQESLSLSPAAWNNVFTGLSNSIVVPTTSTMKVYRLIRP